MANENPDLNEYISMIPTSAFLGDGIGNIMAHIISDSQNRLAEKLAYCEELDCTVMEVRKICLIFLRFLFLVLSEIFLSFSGQISSRIRYYDRCHIGQWFIKSRRYHRSYGY